MDSFSVLSPVAEIAAMESVAATVLRKSTCLTKFEGALNLLSSTSAGLNSKNFEESSTGSNRD